MKLKNLGIILGLCLITIAIWIFDWRNQNQVFISFLLFLSGAINILTDTESESLQKIRNILLYLACLMGIVLIFKILFIRVAFFVLELLGI